jgi:hypothetical protein
VILVGADGEYVMNAGAFENLAGGDTGGVCRDSKSAANVGASGRGARPDEDADGFMPSEGAEPSTTTSVPVTAVCSKSASSTTSSQAPSSPSPSPTSPSSPAIDTRIFRFSLFPTFLLLPLPWPTPPRPPEDS